MIKFLYRIFLKFFINTDWRQWQECARIGEDDSTAEEGCGARADGE